MSTHRPSGWLIAAVVLAHAAALAALATPASTATRAAPPVALLTRAVAAPAPPAAATTAVAAEAPAPPPAQPVTAAPRPAPARPARRPARAPTTTPAQAPAPEPAPPPETAPPPAAEATAAAPVRVADSAQLQYTVTGRARGIGYQADARLSWQRTGERYEAVWSVGLPLVGRRSQRSEGTVTASGLAPERFAEQSRGERAAHFDPAGGRIRFSANTPDAALQPGAQDRLSITLQLGALLAAAPERYPPGTTLVLQTAGARDAEDWAWDVLEDETLSLAGLAVPSARLIRQPRHEHDSRVELWLGRTLQYLPVRLRITQANGDVADQRLSDLAPPR